MKLYSITLTYKCDWDCSYCSADTHSNRTPPVEIIKQRIDRIESNSEVSLTGGEPGYAKREIVEYAFTELKKKQCRINVNTNGAFFVRYPEFCELTDDFFYHCSEDLNTYKQIYRPDLKYVVDYMLIVSDENIDRLDYFITNYPDITFLVTGATAVEVKGRMGPSLSKRNAMLTWVKYKSRIHPDSFRRLIERCDVLCEEEERIIL